MRRLRAGFRVEWTIYPRAPWVIRCPDGSAARAPRAKFFSHFESPEAAMRWALRQKHLSERMG